MLNKIPHVIHPKYRADIDGLRAVAIIPVIIFHAFPHLIPGGFIGVDIFFVISGFLISSIIFSSLERQRFSILDFYIRRIRRIFPALILVLIGCLLFGWFVLLADEYLRLGKHLSAGIAFISNFVYWRESGYFDNQAVSKPLLHLWSLAIEEQFYVFWPLLLAFVWKQKTGFLKITFAIAILSFVANIYLIKYHPVAAFFLPFSRFWELMLGGTLSYITLHRPQIISNYINLQAALGFSLILISLFTINEARAFPGWWALLPTFGAFFIIAAGPSAWLNIKILSNPPMVWFGLISYPLYLWHWPLLSFLHILDTGQIGIESRVIVLIVAIFLAWATYYYVEKPLRFGKHKIRSAVMLVVLMAVLFIISIFIYKGHIGPRIDGPTIRKIIEARSDWDIDTGFYTFHYDNEIFRSTKSDSSNVTVFLGDSHVDQYIPRVRFLTQKYPDKTHRVLFATHEGCLPIPGMFENEPGHLDCNDYRNTMSHVIEDENIKNVIIGACWNCYLLPHPEDTLHNEYSSQPELKMKAMVLLRKFIEDTKKTKKVYLLLDNPIGIEFDPGHYLNGNRLSGMNITNIPDNVFIPREQIDLGKLLKELAAVEKIGTIDPFNLLCSNENNCRSLDTDGNHIYMDGNHLRANFVRGKATFVDEAVLIGK